MNYSNSAHSDSVLKDTALLIVRVFIGFSMLSHGFPKLQMLIDGKSDFFDFLGMGPQLSLGLAVFAEFVCSIFLILGLFSRIALGFLMFTMIIAAFLVHAEDPFKEQEMSLVYLAVYLLLMVFGAGKVSVDYMIEKRKKASNW